MALFLLTCLFVADDGKKLFRDYGILAKNLVELGAVAIAADPNAQNARTNRRIVSLAKARILISFSTSRSEMQIRLTVSRKISR